MAFRDWLDSNSYYSIGHGIYSAKLGLGPDYVIWAYLDGEIKTSEVIKGDVKYTPPEDKVLEKTHKTIWGSDAISRTYSGRYEPQTGLISIRKPFGVRSVPEFLYNILKSKFKYITKAKEF